MIRPDWLDQIFALSEQQLAAAGIAVKDLSDPKCFHKFKDYLKWFIHTYQGDEVYWGPRAYSHTSEFENDEDAKNPHDGSMQFSEIERAFIESMRNNADHFDLTFLDDNKAYNWNDFDSHYCALIDRTSRTRLVLGVRDSYRLFQLPAYINAVDPENPSLGFYACYQNLDLLDFFDDLDPNHQSQYISGDKDGNAERTKLAKDDFVRELLHKITSEFGVTEDLKFITIHHCYSLATILNAFSSAWDIYQYIHIVCFNQEKCVSYGFDLIG